MESFITVNGRRALTALIRITKRGPWFADIVMSGDVLTSGSAMVVIDDMTMSGTIDSRYSGKDSAQVTYRIVGGANGWSRQVSSQHYHSDSGVNSSTVLIDVARNAGEQMENPPTASLGIDYVVRSGFASRILDDIAPGWHVGIDGVTRFSRTPPTSAFDYDVLSVDRQSGKVTIGLDAISDVQIGRKMSQGLDAEITIGEIEIDVSEDSLRVHVWPDAKLDRSLSSIVKALTDRSSSKKIFGKIRYRVAGVSGDRLQLQIIAQSTGAPDVLPVSVAPGTAGTSAVPSLSSTVLVEFIEGDPRLPIVTAFAPKDSPGHDAVSYVIAASASVKIGGNAAVEGVALGASLKTWLDVHTHTAPPGGGPTSPPIAPLSPAPSARVFAL